MSVATPNQPFLHPAAGTRITFRTKLQRGLCLMRVAGADDRDLLGVALLALHGALEDYFRERLASIADSFAQNKN